MPNSHRAITVGGIEYKYLPGEVFDRERGLYVATRRPTHGNSAVYMSFHQKDMYPGYGRFPTNFEWSRALRFFLSHFPDSTDMGSGEVEFTNTVMDFRTTPYPIAISSGRIIQGDFRHNVSSGERRIIPWLPRQGGYVQEWNTEEELPAVVGSTPNNDFYGARFNISPSRLKVVTRGSMNKSQRSLENQYQVNISVPAFDGPSLGFRFVRDE